MPLDIFSVDGAGLQVENYIYMYHLQEFIVLPSFIDSVQENFRINWQQTTPLGRSAPIYSFQSSGPRTIQLTFNLHRDLMYQINKDVSDAKVALGDDYVDTLIKDLQACVLPDYDGTSKAVNPPVVAVRVGSDIFIKGVITSNLGYTWSYPILSNGKYSNLSISFEIAEIDPYDARTVRNVGSYRNFNLNSTLDYGNIIYNAGMTEFTSDDLLDEYGGIVGGNLANMPNQIKAQRALQQSKNSNSNVISTTNQKVTVRNPVLPQHDFSWYNGVNPNDFSTWTDLSGSNVVNNVISTTKDTIRSLSPAATIINTWKDEDATIKEKISTTMTALSPAATIIKDYENIKEVVEEVKEWIS